MAHDYRAISADSHLEVPGDRWEHRVSPKYRDLNPKRVSLPNGGEAHSMKFAGVSFAEWRTRGHDLTSLIANPHFAAPAAFDFHLKTNSPAFKLGFKSINLEGVGVRPKSERASNHKHLD